MNANAFRHFYDYHFAENRKIWDRYVTQLSHEQFTQQADYSHGSVRDQIVHLMSVDEYGSANCEASNPQNRCLPLTLTIGKSFAHTGTTLSKVCASILPNCGTICCSISR